MPNLINAKCKLLLNNINTFIVDSFSYITPTFPFYHGGCLSQQPGRKNDLAKGSRVHWNRQSWKHRALRRTRLVNGYSKWVLKLNSPWLIINTPSFLLFLGYFHEPQWNQQAAVWFSFTYWWTPFGIIMYFTRPQRAGENI